MNAVDLAKELIAFNTTSPPGNEEACAKYLRDHIEGLGLEECVYDLHTFERGRANLIVKCGPDVPGLVLSGHVDVVPAGDLSKWLSPPFEAQIRGERLFGRGAADMKAAVAAMVSALDSIRGKKLKRRLVFVASAGEEIGYDGLLQITREEKVTGSDARYAVVGEPTEMNVIRGHRGGSTFKVTFYGKSAHASRPELGVNAVENCSLFIKELFRLRKKLGTEKHPDLGSTIITATVVSGGTKSNVVPEACELTLDSRRIPKHNHSLIRGELQAIINKLHKADEGFRAKLETSFESYPLLVPRNHEFVRMVESITNTKATIAPYCTETPFYQRMGMASLVFGPGSVKQAHVPNEYVELNELRQAVKVYSELIHRICV